VSRKAVQPALGSKTFELFRQTALEIMLERTDMSKPTRSFVANHARARLIATYGRDAVRLPSPKTAYRIRNELEDKHSTRFTQPSKVPAAQDNTGGLRNRGEPPNGTVRLTVDSTSALVSDRSG
jgi:hypothetical protein